MSPTLVLVSLLLAGCPRSAPPEPIPPEIELPEPEPPIPHPPDPDPNPTPAPKPAVRADGRFVHSVGGG